MHDSTCAIMCQILFRDSVQFFPISKWDDPEHVPSTPHGAARVTKVYCIDPPVVRRELRSFRGTHIPYIFPI